MRRFSVWVLAIGVASVSVGCGSDELPATAGQTGGNGGSGGAAGAPSAGGSGGAAGAPSAGGSGGTAGAPSAGGSGGTAGAPSAGGSGGQAGIVGSSGGAAGSSDGGVDNTGIAAKHPGDVGIATDPEVVFADDFESYAQGSDLNKNWSAVYQNQYVRITTVAANVYAGKQALEFELPQQAAELSDATDKVISPERDVLYLRYYSKFMPPYDVVGSSHNGSSISAHYFINGQATPGVQANGTNKFLANLEDWRGDAATKSPGQLNIYIYHPEQRDIWGDHFFPSGLVQPNTSIPNNFGPTFVARPDIIPDLDRWYCYEYMLKANTPGQRDGQITVWLDGTLVADFPNLRLRDVATLKIDRFGLSFHIKSNTAGIAKKWYDNVVAATSYIGPIVPP
jgi:hypothetical protein